jgi:hypothetical protein
MLAMRFYLRDLYAAYTDYVHAPEVTGGDTNYVALLRLALEWCGEREQRRTVTFVSFSYDLILERAMTAYWGFNPFDLSAYLSHPRAHLLKPHGSVGWHWGFGSSLGMTAGSVLNDGNRAIQRALIEDVDTSHPIGYGGPTGATSARDLVPALALPVDSKTEFIWPREQGEALDSLKATVTRLLTVGWRGLEPHFLPLLRPLVKGYGKVLVVAGGDEGDDEAVHIQARLHEVLEHVQAEGWRTFGQGFSEALASAELDWFFAD